MPPQISRLLTSVLPILHHQWGRMYRTVLHVPASPSPPLPPRPRIYWWCFKMCEYRRGADRDQVRIIKINILKLHSSFLYVYKIPCSQDPCLAGVIIWCRQASGVFPFPPPPPAQRIQWWRFSIHRGTLRLRGGGGHGREPGTKAHPCVLTHGYITVFVMRPMQLLCMYLYFS